MYTFIKVSKDRVGKVIAKLFFGTEFVPRGMFELQKYFRSNGAINFEFKKEGDVIIAISKNFRYGSIVTSASNSKELDLKIKDAILTSFEVPSSYAKEAKIYRLGERNEAYALA